jgi:hypothetical protein
MRALAMFCNSRQSLAIALAICVMGTGCKRRPNEASPAASASNVEPSARAPMARCQARSDGVFVIGEKTPLPAPDAGDDDAGGDEPGLPFAVEVGRAVAIEKDFGVGALSTKAGVTRALVAVVNGESMTGRTLDLGPVKGDVDPPELASRGGELIALVHDNDANGAVLRLAKLLPGNGITWGTQVAEGKDQSRVADIEIGKDRGVVVWDSFDKAHKHSVVHAYTFSPSDIANVTRPRQLSAEGRDAEAPRIVKRPGGFWVAWVEHAIDPRAPKPKPLVAPPASASASARAPDEPVMVGLGQRTLTAQPLDENAVPSGPVVDVSGAASHVVVFDIAAAPDGGLIAAWRDDDPAAGAEENRVKLVRVRPDKSTQQHQLEDENLGVGAPLLLMDDKPADPDDRTWISLESINDSSRIASLTEQAELADALETDVLFGNGDPLVVSQGRMLVALPKGLAIELRLLGCKRGPPPAPAPARSASGK